MRRSLVHTVTAPEQLARLVALAGDCMARKSYWAPIADQLAREMDLYAQGYSVAEVLSMAGSHSQAARS